MYNTPRLEPARASGIRAGGGGRAGIGQATRDKEFTYFDVQSTWGVTKHMGGVQATDELAALCRVGQHQTVLEVGCGVGITSCHLARRYGCRVIGVDFSGKMIEWARRRAARRGLESQVQYGTADAKDLPFKDGHFDAVLCESVTAFPPDKQRAVSEYARVTKLGGYVGLNEGTWLGAPPSADLVAFIERTMAGAAFLAPDGWRALLEIAGLTGIVVSTVKIGMFSQRLNEMRGLDAQDRIDRLRGLRDFVRLYVSSAAFRRYAREITPSARIIKSLFSLLGYGLYAGRKE